MKSVATREHHEQALREILPLFILLSPYVVVLVYIILELIWKSADVSLEQWFLKVRSHVIRFQCASEANRIECASDAH